jgi:hypothetical protein
MKRALLIAVTSLLISSPAFSQNAPGGGEKDQSYSRMDHDMDDMMRAMGESGRGGMRRRGAAFYLRNGDAVVAVRCDPQDSTKECVDATLTLLERAKAAQPSGAAQGGTTGSQPPSR